MKKGKYAALSFSITDAFGDRWAGGVKIPPVFLRSETRYGVLMEHEKIPGILTRTVQIRESDEACEDTWWLAEEVPVSITVGGVAFVVMMATPADLEDFVTGFMLTEGPLASPEDIEDLKIREIERGFLADLSIRGLNPEVLSRRRRNLPGQASCGICGVVELEEALPQLTPVRSATSVSHTIIDEAMRGLKTHQVLNKKARSLHAAAFFSINGELLLLREDIGRHNALDKLIGAGVRRGLDLSTGFTLLSSRCSVELVQKAAKVGMTTLATISAPTTLAVEEAESAGITLLTKGAKDRTVVVITTRNESR